VLLRYLTVTKQMVELICQPGIVGPTAARASAERARAVLTEHPSPRTQLALAYTKHVTPRARCAHTSTTDTLADADAGAARS
jgi:hypothetical protein